MALPLARALALLTLICAAGGCVRNPTMTLNHAEVSGLSVTLPPGIGVQLLIHVDVYNPNSYDIAIRAVRGQVLLAYKYSVPVDFQPGGDGVWFRSSSTTQLIVPVEVPATTALAVLNETIASPTIAYRFAGKADVTATRSLKLEQDDYSVNQSGWISRNQIQAGLHVSR